MIVASFTVEIGVVALTPQLELLSALPTGAGNARLVVVKPKREKVAARTEVQVGADVNVFVLAVLVRVAAIIEPPTRTFTLAPSTCGHLTPHVEPRSVC